MFALMTGLAATFGVWALAIALLAAAVALALPVMWLWMLIDALLRDADAYPGGRDMKLVWIALLLLVHLSAVAYFLMVFRAPRSAPAPPGLLAAA